MTRRQQLFIDVCTSIFGQRWQSDAARHLNVAIRTVQRWSAGEQEVPASVMRELAALTTLRSTSMLIIGSQIDRHLGGDDS